MRIRPASVRVRLTLWYTLILAAIVLALFAGVYLVVRASLTRQLDREVEAEFLVVSQDLAEESIDLSEFQNEVPGRIFAVRRDGAVVFETAEFKAFGLDAMAPEGTSPRRTVRTQGGGRFRLRSGPAGSGFVLTAALSEEPVRRALRTLLWILVLALPAGIVLAAMGGSVMAGRLLRPVALMAAQAERISAESLSARLPVEDPRDEFGRMAGVINGMLARLQGSFDRLRRFTADASHELRTPLTVIQSVGEVALQEDLDAAAYRDRIGSMLEEVGRLSRLVDSLLTLTRADAGAAALTKQGIDAADLAARTVEDLRPLAEEKQQELRFASSGGPASVRADEATLKLALVNLVDNAIKYTPAGGSITVGVRPRDGEILVEVADNGPGLAPEQAARVFDRFYRGDPSRSAQSGAGLGLSIAKWAVEANGGRIELESRTGQGSTFRLVLPHDIIRQP